jgi:hypothetical protein
VLFAVAQFLSFGTWRWGTRKYSDTLPASVKKDYVQARAKSVERIIAVWAFVLVAALAFRHLFPTSLAVAWTVRGLGVWRCLDIFQSQANAHIWDGLRLGKPAKMTSLERSTLISVWNYAELIGWFAGFYLVAEGIEAPPPAGAVGVVTSVASSPLTLVCVVPAPVASSSSSTWDALYFSAITQLTIGFGDLKPMNGWGRALAVLQGLLGTTMVVLAIGRFVSELGKDDDAATQ